MLCNELHICSSSAASTGRENFTPFYLPPPRQDCIIIIVLQHTCHVLVSALCVRCQEHVQQSLFFKFDQARKSNQRANCFASFFFLLGRDYIPITFINAREIDKQTEDVVEILYTI